ncbi:DUF523 and DUF1722 domain-containing protein [Sulfurimonas sp. HSL3-7]|uniref:YbgA family protein n=1 Tax=Sulfonitrofixus jiaomeiensis TaxID=3131938 RepID=UPI0031F8C894
MKVVLNIAVSGCLLGQKIRFDGGHKQDRFITDELARFATFTSFCPEHLTFGTPRPSVRVVRRKDGTVIESNKSGADVTKMLTEGSQQELSSISQHPLGGIIFKSNSPSCGLGSAKAYLPNGFAEGKTDGVFARLCREKFPLLPMEEEGRLNDPWLRENFVMQLFAYGAFEQFKGSGPSMKKLIDFHQRHKFMLQAKDERAYRMLGNIVGNRTQQEFTQLLARYETIFKTAIARKSSIGKTRNVLEHMAGFVKNNLTPVEKEMLHEQIRDYAATIIPLIVPLSTLEIFARKYEADYLLSQAFLRPYPKELALRSDIRSGK